jgi:hypothetical protein
MVPVANLSLGGRVLTADGAGIRNASVTISGGNLPSPVTVSTGSFGYYNFQGLQTGLTYTVTVSTKKYVLTQSTRMTTLQSNVNDFNFVAQPL